MPSKRPVMKLNYSTFERTMQAVAALAVILGFLVILIYWPQIPERIATHFDLFGKPDSWGGKGSLLVAPVISIVLFLLLSLAVRFPYAYNYPSAITEENAEYMYRNARTMVICLNAEIMCMFSYMSRKQVLVSLGRTKSLGGMAIIIFLAVITGTLIYFIRRMIKSKG